jgi:pimeloyl-ACP methyl ester carboxylesterase
VQQIIRSVARAPSAHRTHEISTRELQGKALTMARAFRLAFVFSVLLAEVSGAARAGTTLVSIPTPRGATQAFILIKPDNPLASVILFAGGNGALGLQSASSMKSLASNFLVRSRDKFAAHKFLVAVIDAPSDQQQGMSAVFRMSSAHAGDIGAVAAYLKMQANAPVWLIGTSNGTFSAAGGAIAAKGIDGLVLTSTVTRAKPETNFAQRYPDAVASMALPEITVPTLIVSHRKDTCEGSPAADAPKLSQRLTRASKVEVALLDGGNPPQSEPCEAKAPRPLASLRGRIERCNVAVLPLPNRSLLVLSSRARA